MPFPWALFQSAIMFISSGFEVKNSKSHVTGSVPTFQADINGFLFLLSRSPPNPGLHLSIHTSIFCSSPFYPISSSVSPSWVPRPLCVASSDLSFLTHTHISRLQHTLTGHRTCMVWRQTARVLDTPVSEQLFPFCRRQTRGWPQNRDRGRTCWPCLTEGLLICGG